MDLFAPNHLILIAIVVLLLFGGKKIPELMRGLGRGMREFNDGKNKPSRDSEESVREREQRTNTSAPPSKTTTTQP
jgi:sec-independent protein translocase protein TatA